MSTKQHADRTATGRARHPAGSPSGGQFAPSYRTGSDTGLTLVGCGPSDVDWNPSESDLADIGVPAPRWAAGSTGFEDDLEPDAAVGAPQLDEESDRASDRWFRARAPAAEPGTAGRARGPRLRTAPSNGTPRTGGMPGVESP